MIRLGKNTYLENLGKLFPNKMKFPLYRLINPNFAGLMIELFEYLEFMREERKIFE